MKHTYGSIEVITGSMFSGKTDELIRRLRRAHIARQKIQVFKPAIDNRYAVEKVTSHAGARVSPVRCLVDESGHVYLATAQGLGLVHSQDVVHIAQALEQQHWPMSDVQATQLPASYGYVPSPAGRWAERSITSR